jgi:hypothetical protein
MYVRSHIENVSGTNKYIYINTDDATKKKYIRENNTYYPVKKYKGIYSLQKKRGGAPGEANIEVKFRVYGIDGEESETYETYVTFNVNINMNDIILDSNDTTYKNIIKDNIILVFKKDFGKISDVFSNQYDVKNNINHFVIIIKAVDNFEVYFKQYTDSDSDSFDITKYSKFYNIIYKRNNKIDSYSPQELKEFLTIFSITDDDSDSGKDNYATYKDFQDIYNEEYISLYKSTLDKLKGIYQ